MMHNKLKLYLKFCILLIIVLVGNLSAQQSINTSGGDVTGSVGKISYSIGQLDYINIKEASGRIDLGVQQVFLQKPITTNNNRNCYVYPNPSEGIIYLDDTNLSSSNFSYEFFDFKGAKLSSGPYWTVGESIDLSNLSNGVYLLYIKSETNRRYYCKVNIMKP